MASTNANSSAAFMLPARDGSAPPSGKCALMSLLNPLLVQLRMPREIAAPNESNWTPTQPWKRLRSDTSEADEDEDDGHTSDSSSNAMQAVEVSDRALSVSNQSFKHQNTTESPRESQSSGAKKARKPTYAVRKEEKEALLQELRVLEARAELLREQVGMPSADERLTLQKAQEENNVLRDARRSHLLSLSGFHSVLSKNMRDQFADPMRTPIHLGRDMAQRRATLVEMRRDRLDFGLRFLNEKFRGVDLSRSFEDATSWTTENGDFMFQRSDVSHFEGVQSVKQVFDALLFYMVNMEISISEQLGQLTLREDIDCIDTKISNHRIVSSTDHGVVVELNSVNFSEYIESCADREGEEFALFTCDTVDKDDLYPFRPQERVRKTITASVSVSLIRRPVVPRLRGVGHSSGGEKSELMVVMRRCAYLCIYKPEFEISPAALEDMKTNVASWGAVMAKTVRDTVYTNATQAAMAIST